MINKEMYTEPVLPDSDLLENSKVDKDRMMNYKKFSVGFSYPEGSFFEFFPNIVSEKEEIISEYDRLFRAGKVWLYGEEYIAKTEFQRANNLAAIMGFYRAFGVEPDKDRPDSLTNELEFMHYLIFKRLHALKSNIKDANEKVSICLDAEKKFFAQHLCVSVKKIADKIISQTKNNFYKKIAEEMIKFLESEKRILGKCE